MLNLRSANPVVELAGASRLIEGQLRTVFVGGEEVDGGVYFSVTALGFVTVPRQGGTLPGVARDRYLRTPPLLVVLISPIFGVVLAIFLPLSGLIVLAIAIEHRWRRRSSRRPLPQEMERPSVDTEVPLGQTGRTPAAAEPPPEDPGQGAPGEQPKDDGVTR